jgi:hypothetical protein
MSAKYSTSVVMLAQFEPPIPRGGSGRVARPLVVDVADSLFEPRGKGWRTGTGWATHITIPTAWFGGYNWIEFRRRSFSGGWMVA